MRAPLIRRRDALRSFVTIGGTALAVPVLRGTAHAMGSAGGDAPEVVGKDHKLFGKVETPPSFIHPYWTDESWEGPRIDYLAANRIRPDTRAKRPDKNVIKHRPNITVSDNRREVRVDFINEPRHPHEKGHWWSWVEVWDGDSDPYHIEVAEPAAGETMWGDRGVDFTAYLYLPEALADRAARVRAYCVTHGIYLNYKAL